MTDPGNGYRLWGSHKIETKLKAKTLPRLDFHYGIIYYFCNYCMLLLLMEKKMATHSSVLAWRILGMGEPGGPQSMGSHRVGHD